MPNASSPPTTTTTPTTPLRVAITGATSGIGLELAKLFYLKGAHLLLAGRTFDRLEQELKALQNTPSREPIHLPADLASSEGIGAFCKEMDAFDPDLVIHSAGFTHYDYFAARAIDSLRKEQSCHFEAAWTIASHFLAKRKQGGKQGTLVLVSSVLAYLPSPAMAMYGALKAAMSSLALSLDAEERAHGIRTFACAPGPVMTSFQKRASQGLYQKRDPWASSAASIARTIARQIEREQQVTHPGLLGWGGWALAAMLPKGWLSALLMRRVAKRIPREEASD